MSPPLILRVRPEISYHKPCGIVCVSPKDCQKHACVRSGDFLIPVWRIAPSPCGLFTGVMAFWLPRCGKRGLGNPRSDSLTAFITNPERHLTFPASIGRYQMRRRMFPALIGSYQMRRRTFPASIGSYQMRRWTFPASIGSYQMRRRMFPASIGSYQMRRRTFPASIGSYQMRRRMFPAPIGNCQMQRRMSVTPIDWSILWHATRLTINRNSKSLCQNLQNTLKTNSTLQR